MKNLVKFLLLLALLLPLTAIAHDFEVDGIYYNIDGSNAYVTYRGDTYNQYANEYTGDVTIPSAVTFNGTTYPVTEIGGQAFVDCIGLNSVTIPNSITKIGTQVFDNCTGLNTMTIPNSVTFIGSFAFVGCTGLTSVTIGSSVTSIGDYVFNGCSGLNYIAVESGNTCYDSRDNCNAIIETATNTLITGCKNTVIPASVTTIGGESFLGCSGLTTLSIPNSVTKIGNGAFYGCIGLTSVTIPNTVTSMGRKAFYGCTGLSSVTIECGNINGSGSGLFYECPAIEDVIVRLAYPPDIPEDFFDEGTYQSATLHVPTSRTAFFQEHNVWKKFATIVEEDMPDVDINTNPFDDLNSKRLIIGYSRNDAGGTGGANTRPDHLPDHMATAIKLPAERMTRIKGNKITHIRFKLWHTDVSEMKVWIGSSRDKRDLVYQDVTDLHTEWNDITLEQPYTITGDSIIVGVDFCLAYLWPPIPVTWASYDGEEDGTYLRYSNGQWETREGTHAIQCLVEGDSIPEYDIHLVKVGKTYSSDLYSDPIKSGERAFYTITLRNWGSKIIMSNEIELLGLLDGEEIQCSPCYTQGFSNNPGLREFYVSVTPNMNTLVGVHQLTLTPKSYNGVEFHSPESLQTKLRFYEHDMGRQKILIQNYTGSWCGYCPEFDSLIAEKMKERNDLALISIKINESGQTAVDQAYETMLYRDGIPDVVLNRCEYQEKYNFRDYTIKNYLDFAKAQPSSASVKITGEYDEVSRVMDITVSGKRNEDFIPLEGWTNLTVLLVEDSVLGSQAGSDLSPYYPHNGVIRKNVSAIWGDLVQWYGDYYEMHYSTKLDPVWNPKHMRVVAFLGKPFTGDNYDDIIVVNCNEYRLYNEHIGDVNGDSEVNIADINAVIGMILSGSSDAAGDVNDDGEVNIADMNVIIKAILNH